METSIFRFEDVSNYRGCLEIKEADGQYYWRVNCDVELIYWEPIPQYLFDALKKYHGEGV